MGKIADKYFLTDSWKVIEKGYDDSYGRVSESVFALSNETLGVRGYFDEGGKSDSLRGAYVNGVYETTRLGRSYKGIIDKTHFMIPTADWLYTSIEIDGEKLDLSQINFSEFTRELDLRAGTLERKFIWHTKSGKDLQLTFLRFVDMAVGERAYQRVSLLPLNFSGEAKVSSGIDFDAKHEGRDQRFWGDFEICTKSCAGQATTRTSKQELFAAAVIDFPGSAESVRAEKAVVFSSTFNLTENVVANVDKRAVVLFNHKKGNQLWQQGQTALKATGEVSFEQALETHKQYWENFWKLYDISIQPATPQDADIVAEEQQGIRFCIFQMAQTYRGGNERHNIGAKGLTGESYNGHAFWDTETCCLPFYLFTNPEAAKSLLVFRYSTLPQALERAKMLDCEGACFPIATLNGEEACDLWQHASIQYQPSSAVAYGIWHYVHLTNDKAFLWEYGAELLAQIARFMVSRAGQNHTGKYGYFGVMGPDEFHMMVNNNAYTNYMGKRSIEYAIEALGQFKAEKPDMYEVLIKKIGLADAEIVKMKEVAANMAMPVTEDGLFEQHDGYFDLPYLDVDSIPTEDFPLYSNWSYDRIYRTSMIKQPDVLMFMFLYNSSFSKEQKRVNYEYYEPRTIHESSLSPAIHSIFAAELKRMDEALKFFGFATRLDLDNYNRNTNEGLHTTSIAMAWLNIVYGFAGLRSDSSLLSFAPVLPDRWKELKLSITWQGRVIEIEMQHGKTTFTLHKGDAMELVVNDKKLTLDKTLVVLE